MKQRAAPRRRGGEELRQAILRAATEVFLEAGYAGASIDAVIERAGGSKRAVYSHFGGKQELFTAIVREVSSGALASLERDERLGRDARATLLDFGMRVLPVLMTPSFVALYRLVVAEAARFPELARAFYSGGPGRAAEGLAHALEEFTRRGELRIPDCRRAAEHFIGMLRDDVHLQVVLGVRAAPTRRETERAVREVVDLFLHGCRRT